MENPQKKTDDFGGIFPLFTRETSTSIKARQNLSNLEIRFKRVLRHFTDHGGFVGSVQSLKKYMAQSLTYLIVLEGFSAQKLRTNRFQVYIYINIYG